MAEEVIGAPEGDDKPAGPYKVVEISTVTDEAIESVLNEWSAQGFVLQGIHFAMRESSKRPAMAFVVFSR
jgi:hypothetical protein